MSEPKRKRVMLVWPVFAHVLPMAFQNFLRLVIVAARKCPDFDFDPWVLERMSVHGAMNQAVQVALEQGHDYLIAFDDDCLPELADFPMGDNKRWQVIPRLLGLGEKGHKIIMGTGYMRGYPHTTTIGRKYPWGTSLVLPEEGEPQFKGFYWLEDIDGHKDELDADGLLRADFCGVPIVCIHRSVLEKVEKPLFETLNKEDGSQSTHDVYFCNKATAAGFEIKVDTHIDCGHIIAPPIINKTTKRDMQVALGTVPKKELTLA